MNLILNFLRQGYEGFSDRFHDGEGRQYLGENMAERDGMKDAEKTRKIDEKNFKIDSSHG